jgi:hypothetical protein
LPAICLTEDYDPEYMKSSKKLNTKSMSNPIKKWANKLNGCFSKKRNTKHQYKYMKKCSMSLATMEMQMKTTLKFHITPIKNDNHYGNKK